MQTFVTSTSGDAGPFHAVVRTAVTLDRQRLGKQRIEAKQIYNALARGRGAINHPATRMWADHLPALLVYTATMCLEWRNQGYRDEQLEWCQQQPEYPDDDPVWPWWVGDYAMVRTHQSKLLHKRPDLYDVTLGGIARMRLPYLWPGPVAGEYFISAAEAPREWELPPGWIFDQATRQVHLPAWAQRVAS